MQSSSQYANRLGVELTTHPHRNFSLRREGPGLLLGHGRRDEPDGFSTEIDRSLEPRVAERAIHRSPALADAQLMRAWAGLYEMTPDQRPASSPRSRICSSARSASWT